MVSLPNHVLSTKHLALEPDEGAAGASSGSAPIMVHIFLMVRQVPHHSVPRKCLFVNYS